MNFDMKKKNVYCIDVRGGVTSRELRDLLISENLITRRGQVQGKYNIWWGVCDRNDTRVYASKDYQIELWNDRIIIGGTDYSYIGNYVRDIGFRIAYLYPFAKVYELANDIQGKLTDPVELYELRDFYKDSYADAKENGLV